MPVPDGHSHPVAVGIGRQDHVGPRPVGEGDGHGQGFGIFRIRAFHRGKGRILHHLLLHRFEIDSEMLHQRNGRDASGAVDRRENNVEGVVGKDGRIEDHRGGLAGISIAGLFGDDDHLGQVDFQKIGYILQFDPIDLRNDATGLRLHHLAAVFEIHLEAVVVGRIVAGRDHHPGRGPEVADRVAQLRGRPGTSKDKGQAAEAGPGGGGQFAEVTGKIADVVRNHQAWLLEAALLREISLRVAVKPNRRPDDVEVVQDVTAHRRVGRMARRRARPPLRRCRDPADGAAAHPAGAELHVLVESVVQFVELTGFHQLAHAFLRPIRQKVPPQPFTEVLGRRIQQFGFLAGGFNQFQQVHSGQVKYQ